jgi:hypothetical protein
LPNIQYHWLNRSKPRATGQAPLNSLSAAHPTHFGQDKYDDGLMLARNNDFTMPAANS